jgi:hypothetical protein
MTRKQTPSSRPFSTLALVCATAAFATGCEAMQASSESELTGEDLAADPSVVAQLEDLAVRAQVLEDREAIRGVAACYGRGHDEIFRHLQGDQSASLAILRGCFTDDVASDVFFFNEHTPAAKLTSLAQLVGFIEQFAVNTHYTGARNIVGDIGITFTGPDTAVMVSATATPHFIQATGPDAQPTVDVVSARYIDEVVRGADGVWRTRSKKLILDQFWRGTGSYPFAM